MDLPTLPEDTPLDLPPAGQHVDFDDTVELIVPSPDPVRGRPRVQLRKMSLPLSFTKKPSDVDMEDPAFTPNQPRRLSLRLPSFIRSLSPPAATAPAADGLRSCLARTTSHDSVIVGGPSSSANVLGPKVGRTRSHDSTAGTSCSFPSLAGLSLPSLAGTSLPTLSAYTSPLSSAGSQHVPRTRRRSSASSSQRPHPPSPGLPCEAILLPLRACCARCQRLTDSALQGAVPERFSPGAARKHALDLQEAAKDEEMKARWRLPVRVDEVQKKEEGQETGLPETDPADDDDDDDDEAGGGYAVDARPPVAEPGGAASTKPCPAAAWLRAGSAVAESPATDETCPTETTGSCSSTELATPPPSLHTAAQSARTASPAAPSAPAAPRPPLSTAAAGPDAPASGTAPTAPPGKRKHWSLSLPALPTFANPFGSHSNGSGGGGTG